MITVVYSVFSVAVSRVLGESDGVISGTFDFIRLQSFSPILRRFTIFGRQTFG